MQFHVVAKVVQVAGPGGILITVNIRYEEHKIVTRPEISSDEIFLLVGASSAGLTDGVNVEFFGSFSLNPITYKTVGGAEKTINSIAFKKTVSKPRHTSSKVLVSEFSR